MDEDMQAIGKTTRRRHFIVAALAFAGAAFAGGAQAQQAGKASAGAQPLVLVVGDSISAEYGLRRGTGWVALLDQRLKQDAPAVRLVNASISGDTSSGGRARLPALLKQHQPSVVVLELGANDALRGLPLAMTEANLRAMTEAAQQAGARVLLLGMQVPPNYGAAYTRDFAAVFYKTASATRSALVPFLLKGVADTADPTQWFQADRIHPNEAAQAKLLGNVWPALKPMLPARSR